ncbi:MAG: DUF4012 domain-containing protein [Patescibacteria group bacterium]|nr:DUF4012 domain-containing protein [Patescibacteria group bacterium]MDD5715166.1 DUF4012 domain-containing protein [Patescibacteria group bacterium]
MATRNNSINSAVRQNGAHRSQIARYHVPHANLIDLRKVRYDNTNAEKTATVSRTSRLRAFFLTLRRSITSWIVRIIRHRPEKHRSQETVIVTPNRRQVQLRVAPTPIRKPEQMIPETEEIPQERIDWLHSRLPLGWRKRLMVFAGICAALSIPFITIGIFERASDAKGKVLGSTSDAYDYLQSAGGFASSSSFNLAGQEFNKASASFSTAREELERTGGLLLDITSLVPNKAQSAHQLLIAGQQLSQAGATLSTVISWLNAPDDSTNVDGGSSLVRFIKLVQNELPGVIANVDAAVEAMDAVRLQDIPGEYQDQVAAIQKTIPTLQAGFHDMVSVADVMLTILGDDASRRFLLAFQNNRELRPTGGFIGSIALVDIYKGTIENLEVPGGGVYDVAGQLKEKIIAPRPLWLVNAHWNLQDANWFFDFPTSAQKIGWFFERTAGASVDGVITLTPAILESLLSAVGPIDMQEAYGVTVDESNVVYQAQYWAEIAYDRVENQPKRFISDLMPKLLDRLFNASQDEMLSIVGTLQHAILSRDLLIHLFDDKLQEDVVQVGADGGIRTNERDYIALVSTNIGGGKTDHVIDQFIKHEAKIHADGSVTDTVTVTRAHRGNGLDQWEKVANVSYLRLYVPQGSTLLNSSGFDEVLPFRYLLPDTDAVSDEDLAAEELSSIIDEKTGTRITEETGKTVFGNWVSLDPGEVQRITFEYQLPFKLDIGGMFDPTDYYSLYVQKQPGANPAALTSLVTVDTDLEFVWKPDHAETKNERTISLSADLGTDAFYGCMLKK